MTRGTAADQVLPVRSSAATNRIGWTAAALGLSMVAYSQIVPFSDWAVSLLPVERRSQLGKATAFFLYDTPKVLLLLTRGRPPAGAPAHQRAQIRHDLQHRRRRGKARGYGPPQGRDVIVLVGS